MSDKEMLDWLQERVVDTIYLHDGKIMDVRGGNVREAIQLAAKKPKHERVWTGPGYLEQTGYIDPQS